jgi:DNA-binding LacI/PurR family transcriptional regulator
MKCNERASSCFILNWCQKNIAGTESRAVPEIIGFDDAPVSEALNLTTIAIPWSEMIDATLDITRRRLRGDTSTAARRILAPRPVIRR